MPSASTVFRAVCGSFHPVYMAFMLKRAKEKAASRIAMLTLRTRSDGVTLGLLLSLMFWGNLLLRCGDVERNPGPPPEDKLRKTRQGSGGRKTSMDKTGSTSDGSQATSPVQPSLTELMDMMQSINNNMQTMNHDMNCKPFCNATFDGWGCWLNTPAGTTASIPCTETIFRFHISNISNNATATKKCDENGTWYVNPNTNRPFSNYTACTFVGQSPEDSFIPIYIFVGGCSLSIIMLLVSLAIFMTFSQLRCERITVHKNLFVSYVLTGTVWILFFTLVILDGDVQHRNPVWCQVLQVLTQYCTTCNFAWMLCEGLYLHVIMAHTFRTGNILLRVLFFIGWGSPFILTVIYALVRGTTQKNTTKCWSRADVLQWITFAPVVISIVVNILILINLVRLLVTKLRQVPDAPQSRKAVRATLILAPLFGVQFLLLPVPPEEDTMLFEVYRYCIAVHTSLQGALVSIMYCFCNGEVTALLKRKWTQHRLMTAHTQKNTALTSLSISEGYTMVQARPDHSASQRSRVGPDTRTSAAPRESVETRPLREV